LGINPAAITTTIAAVSAGNDGVWINAAYDDGQLLKGQRFYIRFIQATESNS